MSQEFDAFRGYGRGFGGGGDRGRDGGGGFRGGYRDFRGFRGGGDSEMSREGFKSYHGGDSEMSRGGFRGDRFGPCGFRGGNRGEYRGENRGGGFVNRGGFYIRGGGGDFHESSWSYRGGDRGGRRGERQDRVFHTNQTVKEPIFREIEDGLQLLVITKNFPTMEETKQLLPNVHSRIRRPTGKYSTSTAHVLLFTNLESLEAGKIKLDKDPNVEATDYMGRRSAKKQAEAAENRQLFMKFDGSPDEESVKKLDRRIQSVTILKSATECWWSTTKVWEPKREPLKSTTLLALFPSVKAATSAIKPLTRKIGTNGLRYVRQSFGMKYQAAALAGTQRNKVVLRDVPKTTTLKDIAELFPDATSFYLYDKTFSASTYCHASLRFKDNKRVTEILDKKEINILGKKVYTFPAHSSLLQNFPQLGKTTPNEKTEAAEEVALKDVKRQPLEQKKKNN